MLKVHWFWICLVTSSYGSPLAKNWLEQNEGEIVYPTRIHDSRARDDLSTKNRELYHEKDATFQIETAKGTYTLDLKQRDTKIHPGHILLHDEDAIEKVKKHIPENCFYDGKIRGIEESDVLISTCSGGLYGSLDDGFNTYDILPTGVENKHILKKSVKDPNGAYDFLEEEDILQEKAHYTANVQQDVTNINQIELVELEKQYIPYLHNMKPKYVETLFSVDHAVLKYYNNNKTLCTLRIINALYQVTKSYQAINVFYVLVALDFQSSDKWTRQTDGGSEYNKFKEYARTLHAGPFKDISIDASSFLSERSWSNGVTGMAGVGAMCSSEGAFSINRWKYGEVFGITVNLGHEWGHNFGWPHDTDPCVCMTPRGCFMGGPKSSRPGFSDCNMIKFKARDYSCLNNYPTQPLTERCGNGIIEGEEECDCGTPEMCKNSGDNCCEPHNCILKKHVQCSHINNPDCCHETCYYRKQGTLCRDSETNCDLPEFCTGTQATCPADVTQRNGISCGHQKKMLPGVINQDPQRYEFVDRLAARHLKFIPQEWAKDKRACFRTTVFGCTSSEASECMTDLSGPLSDSSFTAGSIKSHKYAAYNVKKGRDGWCPETYGDGSWISIDFKQTVFLKAIDIIGGRYSNDLYSYYIQVSDDGVTWRDYTEANPDVLEDMKSVCYQGSCIPSLQEQCTSLWQADTKVADDICWNTYNKNNEGYGTCSPTSILPCSTSNVKCGQLQCRAFQDTPYKVPDFGTSYKTATEGFTTCSLAKVYDSEQVGLGMTDDGTICAADKICEEQECKSITKCPLVNEKECNGKGHCSSDYKCVCEGKYNPATNCETEFSAINGQWSSWGEWDQCSAACNGGSRSRFRHCTDPVPKHGGNNCQGDALQTETCNSKQCPLAQSCQQLKYKLLEAGMELMDGVYTVALKPSLKLPVYCDMTRDGGGWTLIVSSHSNSWTADNVESCNKYQPEKFDEIFSLDYSILKYATYFKDTYKIKADRYEYRLEAQERGRWGGIFSAPSAADLFSTKVQGRGVKVVQKFDEYEFAGNSIELNVPYVNGAVLTTNRDAEPSAYGTITDNTPGLHPSRWIKGALKMEEPEHVWYWIREARHELPRTCFEISKRPQRYKSSSEPLYNLEPTPGKVVSTECDFNRYRGGWTLLTNVITDQWTVNKASSHITQNVLTEDFSIMEILPFIHNNEPAEDFYQLLIEADGTSKNGGIFGYTTKECGCSKTKPKLIRKFGSWNENVENLAKYPPCINSHNGASLLANSMESSDVYGVLAGQGKYMTVLENPQKLKIWFREGGSRHSCNDIKVTGMHRGKSDTAYEDGVYLVQEDFPVYCDMTSTPNEAWTLLMTSVTDGWTDSTLKTKNRYSPTLDENYSILDKGDLIKSVSMNSTFKYKIEADERNRWGGIWRASIDFSLVSTDQKNEAELIEKFDDWTYSYNTGPYKYVPYLTGGDNPRLRTTTNQDSYYGLLAANSFGEDLKRYINVKKSPSAIWYWINENDCLSDYKKVDGGFSQWSSWSTCSEFCGTGVQKRGRKCNNPSPRCNGAKCEGNSEEERECKGACLSSKIMTADSMLCFEPRSGGCSPASGTDIVLRSIATNCQSSDSEFIFNPDSGLMWHKCSGRPVCVEKYDTGTKLIISSTLCNDVDQSLRFQRSIFGSIQLSHKSERCLAGDGGVEEGNHIDLSKSCDSDSRRFFVSGIEGSVHMSIFRDLTEATIPALLADNRYPNSPTHSGIIDNFDIPVYPRSNTGYRLTAYYTATHSGEHVFNVECDDKCELRMRDHALYKDSIRTIVTINSYTGRFQWDKRDEQLSKPIGLKVGLKYYLELLVVNASNYMGGSVRVRLPNGDYVMLTRQNLSATYR